MRRKLRHFAALIGIVVGLGAVATVARGDNAPTTVLIVDGSGSMWARLEPDNRAKIDILREKLSAARPEICAAVLEKRPFRPGDITHSLADIGKARRLLGYEPEYSLERGLSEALPWYIARRRGR